MQFSGNSGALLSGVTFALAALASTASLPTDKKITICHHPPGSKSRTQTIEVSENALAAHLAHGDTLGPCSDSTSAIIPVDGGILTLPGIATVTFLPGTFSAAQFVSLARVYDAGVQDLFDESTDIFAVSDPKIGYLIQVNVGTLQPALPVGISVNLPNAFLAELPPACKLRAFYLNHYSGPFGVDELFELVPEAFPPDARIASFAVPAYAFASTTPGDASLKATITLADPRLTQSPCPTTLAPPVDNYLSVIGDGFGPRSAPTPGASKFHQAIDFAVPVGTPVYAMAAGTVHTVEGTITGGAGAFIRLEHDDAAGGYSRYLHLGRGSGPGEYVGAFAVANGAHVAAGALIGFSGDSGRVTGPHLHAEYAPADSPRINFLPCITPQQDLKLSLVSPAQGTRLTAERTVSFVLDVAPHHAQVPPGTLIRLLVSGALAREQPLLQTGTTTVAGQLPNLWGEPLVTATFQIIYQEQIIDQKDVDYTTVYNWSSINSGPWEANYSFGLDFRSNVTPDHTATENHTGNGHVGSPRFGAGPFLETFARSGWVNSYGFTYDDHVGCTYADIGQTASGLLSIRLSRFSCYSPPIPAGLPPNLDFHLWLMVGYVQPTLGASTFQGPDGPNDNCSASLAFQRIDTTDYPSITCSRSFKIESADAVTAVTLSIRLRRIPRSQ